MRSETRNLFAMSLPLTLAAMLAAQAAAQQTDSGQKQANRSGEEAVLQAVHDAGGAEDCEACGFLSGGAGGSLDLADTALNPACGRFFGGAEYLSVRATFSESTAFIANTTDPVTLDESTVFGELGFDYDNSYRVFAGYELPECGGRFEFGFTNLTSGGSTTSPIADATTSVAAPLAELPALPGQAIQTTGSVDAQMFDIAFSRAIPLGSPPCCTGCTDGCCDTGCGCWCPAWDITWTGGLRYADVDWSTQSTTVVAPTTIDPVVDNSLDFNGFGARFGLEGRRYLGRSQTFSLFVKGDISLLLGNVSIFIEQDEVTLPDSTVLFQSTQIVPVTDIVLGATAQLSCNSTITAGYLLSAWHDLGMRGTTATDVANASIPDLSFDDANILGFDGFFLRGEYSF